MKAYKMLMQITKKQAFDCSSFYSCYLLKVLSFRDKVDLHVLLALVTVRKSVYRRIA
jgi:hypothetical protein